MRLADLLSPLPVDRFMGEIFDRRPLHIPAEPEGRKAPIGWPRMSELLAIRTHWSEANIRMILNGRPVLADLYIDEVDTLGGRVRRADPAKVDIFLAMGASMVANSIEDICPEAREITAALGSHFAARAGANAYCSFRDVQAFRSHCDLHDVFAVQCEGEKMWTLYENRAAAPVAEIAGDDAQAIIDSVKGRALMQVRMRPGDLLYIPRGFYHDALASSQASLHVTFSVKPLDGRILFRLIEDMAIEDEAFRAYLPDARLDDGRPLAERLDRLADRVSALLRSSRFAAELGQRQRALAEPNDLVSLPLQRKLEFFARSDRPAELARDGEGAVLSCSGGKAAIGALEVPAQWILERAGFSHQELAARFRAFDPEDLRALVARLEKLNLVFRYQPKAD